MAPQWPPQRDKLAAEPNDWAARIDEQLGLVHLAVGEARAPHQDHLLMAEIAEAEKLWPQSPSVIAFTVRVAVLARLGECTSERIHTVSPLTSYTRR